MGCFHCFSLSLYPTLSSLVDTSLASGHFHVHILEIAGYLQVCRNKGFESGPAPVCTINLGAEWGALVKLKSLGHGEESSQALCAHLGLPDEFSAQRLERHGDKCRES